MDPEERARRIDEQLAESNALMARIDASLARNDAALGRNETELDRRRAVLERNEQAFLDLRAYLQQVTTVLGALATDIRQNGEAFVEETRAQRQALFAILDRLNPEPPTSPA